MFNIIDKKEKNKDVDKISNIVQNNSQYYDRNFKNSGKKIGEGTFGIVFFGFYVEKNFPVAIKCLKINKKNEKSFQKEVNFLNELKDEKYFPKFYYS